MCLLQFHIPAQNGILTSILHSALSPAASPTLAPVRRDSRVGQKPLAGTLSAYWRGGGNFAQDKFWWTSFVTRNSHQIFRIFFFLEYPPKFSAQNLFCQKTSVPSTPFPSFLKYFLMGPGKKTHQIFPGGLKKAPPNFYGANFVSCENFCLRNIPR